MHRKKHAAQKRDAHGKSWVPGRKGQGGEGLSKGYGGSVGRGTGASGPEGAHRPKVKDDAGDDAEHEGRSSPSLPSRETIARVLR